MISSYLIIGKIFIIVYIFQINFNFIKDIFFLVKISKYMFKIIFKLILATKFFFNKFSPFLLFF